MSNTAMRSPVKTTTAIRQGGSIVPISAVPSYLRFPLVVLLSGAISFFLSSISVDYTADLGSVSRRLDGWQDVAQLMGWRTVELGLGWFSEYDSWDLVALSVLSQGPRLYLLKTFYEIKPLAVGLSLLIDILAVYIPFRLLRPLSPSHSASTYNQASVPNTEIVKSHSIAAYTSILAASIYSLALYIAYNSFLPIYLVTYFSDIPTIEAAHSSTPITLFPLNLILGVFATVFIFKPAVIIEAQPVSFNPETATLAETFCYNIWGYNKRSKVAIKRTVVLMLLTGGNTFIRSFMGIKGVEVIGAISYSAVWVAAAGVTGVALGVVGAV